MIAECENRLGVVLILFFILFIDVDNRFSAEIRYPEKSF